IRDDLVTVVQTCALPILQRENVRMVQPRRDLDLAEETLRTERRRQLRPQHFDRHDPAMLDVVREVDRRHAAAPQLTLDRIATREDRKSTRLNSSHQIISY